MRRLGCLSLLLAGPVAAAAPAEVGRWAPTLAECRLDPSMDDVSFRIAPGAVDGHEFSCRITRRVPRARGWHVTMHCAGEGMRYARNETWILAGDRLAITEKGKRRIYLRCAPR